MIGMACSDGRRDQRAERAERGEVHEDELMAEGRAALATGWGKANECGELCPVVTQVCGGTVREC